MPQFFFLPSIMHRKTWLDNISWNINGYFILSSLCYSLFQKLSLAPLGRQLLGTIFCKSIDWQNTSPHPFSHINFGVWDTVILFTLNIQTCHFKICLWLFYSFPLQLEVFQRPIRVEVVKQRIFSIAGYIQSLWS